MIIKQISMKNFQCYVGDHDSNCFEFQEGLNLIIGNNGGGKSKVFDAFYWVLYDQIFNSDTRVFTSTRDYGEKLISDKVTREATIGTTVTTEVTLTAVATDEKEYRLTRAFNASKINDEDNKWLSEPSNLYIENRKATRWSVCSESEDSVLKRVIPPQLKPYMWFQGEQVDGLMDLTDKSALTQIINILSGINKYDDIVKLTDKGSEKASKELRKSQNLLSKNTGKSEQLIKEHEEQEKTINKTKNNITKFQENLDIANIRIEELISKIDDATKKAALKEQKKQLEYDCEKLEQELVQKHSTFNSKIFKDFWILKNANKQISKYSEKYRKYNVVHQEFLNQNAPTTIKSKLPIDVPGPVHIKQMLIDCKCHVCNREAAEGSEAWEHMKFLIGRDSASEKESFKQDCSQCFKELYESSLKVEYPIKETSSNINKEFNDLASIRKKISESKSKITSIKNNFESLLEEDSSESIVSAFRQHELNKEIFTSKLTKAEASLKSQEDKLSLIQQELNSLVTGEIEVAIRNADTVFKSLVAIAKSTRKDVYTALVKELEMNANSIFKGMASRNNAITGKIQLKMLPNDTCIPEIIGHDGFIMSGSNDSNIILVKLSLIIAILTSNAKWSENYALISDAPTAKMAKGYSEGFYEALSKHFKQSIVMTYDFISPEERLALRQNNSFEMGSIYLIESHFPNGNREDRSDLEIILKKDK